MNGEVEQANTDVSALQDKLSSKNSDIVQLISSNEELKQKVDELSCGNNSSEVKDLQSKLDQAVVIATRVHELQDEVKDLKDSSEESQTAQANQTADKKFTPI
jgi:chromosome segregation ATPase